MKTLSPKLRAIHLGADCGSRQWRALEISSSRSSATGGQPRAPRASSKRRRNTLHRICPCPAASAMHELPFRGRLPPAGRRRASAHDECAPRP